jgi:hypothetical protein
LTYFEWEEIQVKLEREMARMFAWETHITMMDCSACSFACLVTQEMVLCEYHRKKN